MLYVPTGQDKSRTKLPQQLDLLHNTGTPNNYIFTPIKIYRENDQIGPFEHNLYLNL